MKTYHYVIIGLVIFIALVSQCALPTAKEPVLSRLEQVEKCGSCHQDAYHNWKIGPHAQAYAKLEEHVDLVLNSDIFPEPYKGMIAQNPAVCKSCHVSENIFDTRLKGLEKEENMEKFTQAHYPEMMEFAVPRTDSTMFVTGIDCLTCHASGDKVLTTEDFKPSGQKMEGQCQPVASTFFTKNISCVSCHKFVVNDQEELAHQGMEIAQKTCNSCHQEYDSEGKGTHYYYWRHDPEDKVRPKNMRVFDVLDVQLKNQVLAVSWENTISPHSYSECGESIADIEVFNEAEELVFSTQARLNRKIYHDKDLQPLFKDEPVSGIEGYTFSPKQEPYEQSYKIEKRVKKGKIKITGKQKAQYWAKDDLAEVIYTREISF